MFLGMQFSGDSFFNLSPKVNEIIYIDLQHGIYDELYGTVNINLNYPKQWDYDTRFYAKFQNNLYAGNVDYAADIVSAVRIKRRESSKHKWLTLYQIPITCNDDFKFELFDHYVQNKHEYYYSIVPIMGNTEGNINQNNIMASFDDYYILDRNISYPIHFNVDISETINRPIEIVSTLGRKYPFVISNGLSEYKSGHMQFYLLPLKDCLINEDALYKYQEQFNEWIMNGEPKIIKGYDEKIYMVKISSNIEISYDNTLPMYSFDYTEIGNVLDNDSLYYNHFIDANPNLATTSHMFFR